MYPLFSACRANAWQLCHTVQQSVQDVGTVDSGLNSTVLASNNEMVILPVNEPTFGTRRKSQIQVHAHPPSILHISSGCILRFGSRHR